MEFTRDYHAFVIGETLAKFKTNCMFSITKRAKQLVRKLNPRGFSIMNTQFIPNDVVITNTSGIVTTYLLNNKLAPAEVPNFIREIISAFLTQPVTEISETIQPSLPAAAPTIQIAQATPPAWTAPIETQETTTVASKVEFQEDAPKVKANLEEKLTPAVPITQSVTADYIICLEDGKRFKTLKRHLQNTYNMTPEQYRIRWNLDNDYPVVATNYSKSRSTLARKLGLGRKPGVKNKKKAA